MTAATAMDQKKKRKRKRSSVFLPHDLIVEELLTRLPAKSLMRFKCVSKLWCSTILDPAFCNVYCESRVMVLIDLLAEGASGFGYLRRATLCRRRRVLELLDDDVFYMPDFERATEVINGLVCLYTADDHRVSICNVTTREIMDLPLSHLNQNIHSPQTSYQYYLGLGATWNSECSTWNSEYHYKLLRACTFVAPFVDGEDIHHITECEILTVGKDSSWRVLQGPTRALDLWNQNSVYFNGLLFWWNRTHQVIIAFYFGAEEFVEISSPSRGQICEGPLYQCRGCLVLVVGLVDRKLELWAFEEEKEKSNYGGGETVSPLRKWIKHVIDIPYAFSAERGCQLIGNLPIGAIFMTFGIPEQEEEKEINNSSMSPVMAIPPIVSYDLTTRKVENFIFANEFSTSQDSLLNDPGRFRLSYYIEDISPLRQQIIYQGTHGT